MLPTNVTNDATPSFAHLLHIPRKIKVAFLGPNMEFTKFDMPIILKHKSYECAIARYGYAKCTWDVHNIHTYIT